MSQIQVASVGLPVSIANGGTGASSFSTTNGIVKYNGTSLVTSTTALIDASNRETNTSQPAFLACLSAQDINVTGDLTSFRIGSGQPFTLVKNQGTVFSTTGVFTAPVTGMYLLGGQIYASGATKDNGGLFSLVSTSYTYRQNTYGGAVFSTAFNNFATLLPMTAGDTASFYFTMLSVANAKDWSIYGAALGTELYTWVYGYLVC
jgi:hypothetical protein